MFIASEHASTSCDLVWLADGMSLLGAIRASAFPRLEKLRAHLRVGQGGSFVSATFCETSSEAARAAGGCC